MEASPGPPNLSCFSLPRDQHFRPLRVLKSTHVPVFPQHTYPSPSISSSQPSTPASNPKSIGLDFCATSSTILSPDDGVTPLPVTLLGSPPPNSVLLALGRALSALTGLLIYLTVLSPTFPSPLHLFGVATQGPLLISPGQVLARALPLPSPEPPLSHSLSPTSSPPAPTPPKIFWIQQLTQDRPCLKLKLDGRVFEGILDSGADSTVLSQASWPTSWPCQPSLIHLQGIEVSTNTLQSSKILRWKDPDGPSGSV